MPVDRHATYMLDTVVFNDLLKLNITRDLFANLKIIVTQVQRSELLATKDEAIRTSLLNLFEAVCATPVAASSFLFGVEGAGWDEANWSDGSGIFEKMLARLRELDAEKRCKRKMKPEDLFLNQLRDVSITETALKVGAILVTRDKSLRTIVGEFGGRCTSMDLMVSQEPREVGTRV